MSLPCLRNRRKEPWEEGRHGMLERRLKVSSKVQLRRPVAGAGGHLFQGRGGCALAFVGEGWGSQGWGGWWGHGPG